MSLAALVTIPARNLRPGDRIPRLGAGATVAEPPAPTADAAVIAVAVTLPGAGAPRLARIAAQAPVEVLREAAPAVPYVRREGVARTSGARIQVLDLTHPDSDLAPQGDYKHATRCIAHQTVKLHRGISTAEAQARHPEAWCDACNDVWLARARERVAPGTPEGLRRAG